MKKRLPWTAGLSELGEVHSPGGSTFSFRPVNGSSSTVAMLGTRSVLQPLDESSFYLPFICFGVAATQILTHHLLAGFVEVEGNPEILGGT